MDADGGNQRPLTDQVSSTQPVWSPDGDQIAFVSERYGYSEIFVSDADGGNLRQLTARYRDRNPTWAPDADFIAFTSDGKIFLVNTETSSVGPLTTPSTRWDEQFQESHPAWSADGRQIAYLRTDRGGDHQIVVAEPGKPDAGVVVGVRDRYARNARDLAWSPDGETLSLSSDNLFKVDADGGNRQEFYLHFDSTRWWWPSPDGAKIVYRDPVGNEGEWALAVGNLDDSNSHRLADGFQGYDVGLAWSPDGRRMAFHSQPDGPNSDSEIFYIEADGENFTSLTDNDHGDRNPVWSPDGSSIAFERSWGGAISLMDETGANLTRLTTEDTVLTASWLDNPGPWWSPDGRFIAFTTQGREDALMGLSVVGIDGAESRQLGHVVSGHVAPSWSPDSNQLAFAHFHDEVFVAGLQGGEPRQISVEGRRGVREIEWSSDGSVVAYLRGDTGDTELHIVTLDPTNPRVILEGRIGNLTWSPNGSRIAFTHPASPRRPDSIVVHGSLYDTRPFEKIHEIANGALPSWSPDGVRLLFIGRTSDRPWDYDVFSAKSHGGGLEQLTANDQDDFGPWCYLPPTRNFASGYPFCDNPGSSYWGPGPIWSPDGARIAFTIPRDGFLEIFVADADGDNLRQLTTNTHPDYPRGWQRQELHLRWSPDSTRILFASDRDGDYEIYVAHADGSSLIQLTDNHHDDRNPEWSPTP